MTTSCRTIRFGLVGYGAWGSHHAQAIRRTAGAELAAIAVPSAPSQTRAAADHPGVRIYSDYTELLRREELDVIDVVLPNYLHHVVARAALEAGRHVLLEKPMALTVAHCDELIAMAQQQCRVLAVGFELRQSSLWRRVRQMIDAGDIGRPLYLLIELWRRPYRTGAGGWRYDIGRVGNWVLEEPIHFFDLARWYLASSGDPVSVYARANSRQADHPELQDNFSAIVNFANGAYAVISQTLAADEHHQTVKVTGTNGSLWASWSGAMDRTLQPTFALRHHDGRQTRDVPIETTPGEVFELQHEIAMMAGAVRDGTPVSASGADGRWAVALCLAAQRSIEHGMPVPADQRVE